MPEAGRENELGYMWTSVKWMPLWPFKQQNLVSLILSHTVKCQTSTENGCAPCHVLVKF